jgi:hypothetical protein
VFTEDEFRDLVGTPEDIVGKRLRRVVWYRVRFHGGPPKLLLIARAVARAFPRRQMGVLALNPA